MKKYIKVIIFLFLISAGSCKKFLDTVPKDSLSPENYYETEAQLNLALAGVYDILGKKEIYGDRLLGYMGLDADEAYYGAGSTNYLAATGRAATVTGVVVYDVSATDPQVADCWRLFYDGINRANLLLENINKPVMNEDKRNAIKGEALFLRAYYHFMLVSNWGDVPLMLKAIKGASEINVPRTPAKEVYEQIIKDMTEAESLVLTADKVVFGGRISKSAVRGILARVCLYMAGNPVNDVAKYAEAKKWAEKVMIPPDGFQHALNPSYAQVFINMCQDKYDIKESIWEVEFYGNATGAFNEGGRVGSNNGVFYVPATLDPNYGYSYGFISATGSFFKTYESAVRDSFIVSNTNVVKKEYSPDLRRDWAIAPYKLSTAVPVVKTMHNTDPVLMPIWERSSGKWKRELELASPRAKDVGPINFPLLRFSDVLLMYAEAVNAIGGPTQVAVDAVNQVRRRAYGKYLFGEVVNYSVTVNSGGSGYTSAPTIKISGGGGTGATAVAKIVAGKVSQIVLTKTGEFFTSAPDITITGGGGSGASATATITAANSADLKAEQVADKNAFLSAIQEERSRELCFECLRKRDLVRWGIFIPRMKKVASDFVNGDNSPLRPVTPAPAGFKYGAVSFNNVSERDALWPIAPREMQLNQSLKPQNPGW